MSLVYQSIMVLCMWHTHTKSEEERGDIVNSWTSVNEADHPIMDISGNEISKSYFSIIFLFELQ